MFFSLKRYFPAVVYVLLWTLIDMEPRLSRPRKLLSQGNVCFFELCAYYSVKEVGMHGVITRSFCYFV